VNNPVPRRQFLKGMTTVGAAALLQGCKSTNVGRIPSSFPSIQLYMLGEAPMRDLKSTLQAISSMGYRSVELPGSYGLSAQSLRAALDAEGLSCPSVHIPLQRRSPYRWSFDLDRDQISEDMQVLGARHVVVPIFWNSERTYERMRQIKDTPNANVFQAISPLPAEDWQRLADLLNEHAQYLARSQIRLGYHNHGIEFVSLPDGRTGYDILIERLDPTLVDFQLDVGWATGAGANSRALLDRLGPRVKLLHLKDVKATSNAFSVHSTDFGTGIVPWGELIPAIQQHRIPILVVEQEPPFDTSAFDSARVACQFLSRAFSS
jgi:sugar phosphate isomerase/epimerase